jgi:hypothetical protein
MSVTHEAVAHETSASQVQVARVQRGASALSRDKKETQLAWFPAMSRGQLITVLVLCGLFLLGCLFPLNHTDLWGHLAYGRLIAESGTLPTVDPFGATESVYSPLVDLWWLSQVVGYGWYAAFGLEGLSFAHGLLLMLFGAGVMQALRLRGVGLGLAAAAAVSCVLIAIPALGTLRPQLLAAAMFPCVLIATDVVRRHAYPLVGLPLLFAVWANVHESFLLGRVVLGVIALDAMIGRYRAGGNLGDVFADRTVRRLALLCVAATAATLLNPYGLAQVAAALEFSRNPVLADISEWQRLAVGSIGGVALAISSLIAVIALVLDRQRVRPRDIMLLVMLAVATVAAQRMLIWWAVVWAWVTVPHLARVLIDRGAGAKGRATNHRHERLHSTQRRTVLAIIVVLMTLVWAPPTYAVLSGTTRGVGRVVSRETPIDLAEAMNEMHIAGAMFTPMDWGDYLIWSSGVAQNSSPVHDNNPVRDSDPVHDSHSVHDSDLVQNSDTRVQPLVYSHVHLLTQQVWHDYLAIAAGEPEWLELVDRHGLEYLAVRRQAQFDLYVAAVYERRCRIVYQDQTCVLFEVLVATSETSTGAPRR